MGVIAFSFRKNSIYIWSIIFAFLVGISRIAVGAHWPLDVIGGAMLGWFCAWVGVSLADRSRWGYSRTSQIIYGIVLLICTVDLLFFYNTHYALAEPAKWGVGVICLAWGAIGLYHVVFNK